MNDYYIVMTEKAELPVNIAELKARLSEYLRQVKAGRELVVYDRSQPVARVVPMNAPRIPLVVREPAAGYGARLADIKMPPPVTLPVDPVELLLEDRNSR
jgi:prevent-host-death family protein